MPDMIRDGKGRGFLAEVDEKNDLHVRAISVEESIEINTIGNAYNINTGAITLTNDAETPVIYLKNNDTKNLIITAIAVGLGPTNGTSSDIARVTVVRNPTTGTIVDNKTAVAINSNRNYGLNKTLNADVYKGATGATMTNGTDHLLLFQGLSGRLFSSIDEVIPFGSTIGVKIDPQTSSNTSLSVYAALICYLK